MSHGEIVGIGENKGGHLRAPQFALDADHGWNLTEDVAERRLEFLLPAPITGQLADFAVELRFVDLPRFIGKEQRRMIDQLLHLGRGRI